MQKVIRLCLILSLIFNLTVPGLSQNNTSRTILMQNPGIFLRDDETWRFYQGYSITLRDVSDDTKYAWLQLSQNGRRVEDAIVTSGTRLLLNESIGNKTIVIFNITIKEIYSNPDGNLVILSPVTQYYNPSLPLTTPEPIKRETTPITPTTTPERATTAHQERPYTLALSALTVLVLTIYVLKKL